MCADLRGDGEAFGGRYVSEPLVAPLEKLAADYDRVRRRRRFRRRLEAELAGLGGRPTPLLAAEGLSRQLGGAHIVLKREDLLPTGGSWMNNALAQALLAAERGKGRLIAVADGGGHGAATATAAARVGLACTLYLARGGVEGGRDDPDRLRLFGAEVVRADGGEEGALNEALRDWVAHAAEAHFAPGSVLAPDPHARMVRDFQGVIGRETRRQLRGRWGRRSPDLVVASVTGDGAALGLFDAFLDEARTRLVGVEAGGKGSGRGRPGKGCAENGSMGVHRGAMTLLLQDWEGRLRPTPSVAAGLGGAAVGPGHAALARSDRVEYAAVTDGDAFSAFRLLAEAEGILVSLESAHALARAAHHARRLSAKQLVVVAISAASRRDEEALGRRRDGSLAGEGTSPSRPAADWVGEGPARAS